MILKKYTLAAVLLLVFAVCSFGQDAAAGTRRPPTAPVKWERYSITGEKISVMLPKMPTLIAEIDPCLQTETQAYYAFANNVVYEVRLVKKSDVKQDGCRRREKFGKQTIARRLAEVSAPKDTAATRSAHGDRQFLRFENSGLGETRLIFDDVANGRWVELAVRTRPVISLDKDRYFDSLQFVDDGIEIRYGARETLGDELSKPKNEASGTLGDEPFMIDPVTTSSDRAFALSVVAKHKALYNDSARIANTQGTVRLRVTFLSNGAIGSVSVVDALPNGLTESAIVAVRKLVFLPAMVDGVPRNVAKMVEYNFSLY